MDVGLHQFQNHCSGCPRYLHVYSCVGKSCLINRYIKGEFSEQYNVTVGVEYASKVLHIDDNTTLRLQIWDTVLMFTMQAGQ